MKKHLSNCLILFFALLTFAGYSQQTVKGQITGGDGETLIGVTIIEKGTNNGTTSDLDGNYELTVSDGATLVYSYTGLSNKEMAVNPGRMDIVMDSEAQILEEVFITATSRPIRRIETVTAVESIGAKEIERMNPTTLFDLVRFTPGIYVQTQAGRVRNFIFTRGFPDASGNGLVYTSTLIDGIRTFGSPEGIPDASFRNDLNIEKVEVVRGSAATLYGRGAAAGAINIISKTGGTESEGTVKATYGQYNWLQLDANLNGPLNASKTLRYNVGGFWLRDDGFRENLFPDAGGQLRGNIDYIIPKNKGNIRLYGGFIRLNVQNLLSIPYAASDLTRPAGNWTTRNIELQEGNPFEGSGWPITNPASGISQDNPYDPSYADGNFSRGQNIGLNLDLNLENGWTLVNKARLQRMVVGVGFDFSISQNFGDVQQKFIFGGGGTDGGSNSRDFIEELRLVKTINTDNAVHSFTVGGYLSLFNNKVETSGTLYTQNTSDPNNPVYNREPFGFPLNLNFRNGDYNENTTSGFLGYEGKFNDKLTFTIGGRFDDIHLDLTDNFREGQENLQNIQDHSGFSWSAGFNYLFDPLTAVYGNFLSSFRAPDFSTYTPVQFLPMTELLDKPRVEQNEQIRSFEIGIRKSTGDFSFDGGFFNTLITDRTVATFVGAIATQVPVGDNRITGFEVSSIYTPSSAKGLYMRTSITLQNTEYTDFLRTLSDGTSVDLSGNEIANVPPLIFNFSAGYANDKFSINWNNNFLSARQVDIFNTAEYPSRLLMDANASYNFSKGVSLKIGVQNLTNVTHASSVISAQTDEAFLLAEQNGFSGDFANVRGVPYLPRRVFGSLQFKFGLKKKADLDGDGIADSKDSCPDVAGLKAYNGCPDTDLDGIIDSQDGCPTIAGTQANMGCPDSDGDGVVDKNDDCPNTAGNLNGCPDGDGDGVADKNDDCPNQAGTLRGCPDTDGDNIADKDDNCPEIAGTIKGCPDGDGDGVADKDDDCPEESGDAANGCPSVVDSDGDGVQDKDDRCPDVSGSINGCPDTDKDGIVDIDDACPNRGGVIDSKGCPKVVPTDALTAFTNALEGVQFESASAVIKRSSYSILDEVVNVMTRYPGLNVSIEGHTDDRGTAESNQSLSSKRAVAVMNYLIEKGVAGTRMSARGFGESSPKADNSTAAGRKLNRRVEIIGSY